MIDYSQSVTKLKALYLTAKTAYYEHSAPLFSDSEFDQLEEYIQRQDPAWRSTVGAPIRTVKVRAALPIPMFSLDKVKIDTVDKWLALHKNQNVVLMDKLDGASVELVYQAGKPVQAFTRGDGIEGGDISFMIPSMNIPKTLTVKHQVIVRVEALFSTQAFEQYQTTFKSDRNAVSGLLNNQVVQPALKAVSFVVLQVLEPMMKMSKGLDWAAEQGFDVVHNVLSHTQELSADVLSNQLSQRRVTSPYRCDGVVIALDQLNELPVDSNPDWAVAFKENDDAASAPRTRILRVIWEVSSHGYIVPKAEVEPTEFDGATVRFCSLYNTRWMIDNQVGPGAEVAIVRSGDIIPRIIKVFVPSSRMQQPDAQVFGAYQMNAGGTDYVLINPESNSAYQVKRIARCFDTLDVDFLREGTVQRLYDAGFTTVKSIVDASAVDLSRAEGMRDKSAQKVYLAIRKVVSEGVPLPTLMDASGAFPRGIGTRRAEMISEQYDLNQLMARPRDQIVDCVMTVPGFEAKTAEMFASGVTAFLEWQHAVGIKQRKVTKMIKKTTGVLKDVRVTFTGYRDAEQEKQVEAAGGEIVAFGSKTTVLLHRDGGKKSGKLEKAAAKGIEVMTWQEFSKRFGV